MTHGGQRNGAGRKRLEDGVLKSFRLQRQQLDVIRHWRAAHDCETDSEAVRQILSYVGYGAIKQASR